MVTGIIICHSLLAYELVNASQKILGHTDQLFPFSNDNLAPKTMYQNILDIVRKQQTDEILAMVDLRGGSCWTVAKMISREFPKMKVVSGVNIPMVISFLTKRNQYSIEELTAILETDASRGIMID